MQIRKTISLYWQCQLAGWISAAAYWGFTAYISGNFDWGLGLSYFVLDVMIGIGITHAYREFVYQKSWQLLELRPLRWRLAGAIICTGVFYMVLTVIKNYYVRSLFVYQTGDSLADAFKRNALTITATGIRLMAIWILAFHLYHYARQQINTARENAQLQIIAKEMQLAQLSTQLNPHFFFNSINTVKALVGVNADQARRAIDLLSELLRRSLYGSDHQQVLLREELSMVSDYLELEKLRFEERLSYQILCAEGLLERTVPPLSIQTITENAIKHGIAGTLAGGIVTVQISGPAGGLLIRVSNTGNPEPIKQQHGLGLRNLRQRLQLQYGMEATLDLSSRDDGTVTCKIFIPFHAKS